MHMFLGEWLESSHRCGSTHKSDSSALGGLSGCLCPPSLFLEVTESALWSACPPNIANARHPSCPAQVGANCVYKKVHIKSGFVCFFKIPLLIFQILSGWQVIVSVPTECQEHKPLRCDSSWCPFHRTGNDVIAQSNMINVSLSWILSSIK